MAMSGVTVQDQCVKMWEKMKTSKIKACQFKLTANNKEIEVVEESVIEKGTEGAWKKFTSSLPENQCRYAIYDVEMSIDLGAGLPPGTRTKLTFIVWAPQSSPIKQKNDFRLFKRRIEEETRWMSSRMATYRSIRTRGQR